MIHMWFDHQMTFFSFNSIKCSIILLRFHSDFEHKINSFIVNKCVRMSLDYSYKSILLLLACIVNFYTDFIFNTKFYGVNNNVFIKKSQCKIKIQCHFVVIFFIEFEKKENCNSFQNEFLSIFDCLVNEISVHSQKWDSLKKKKRNRKTEKFLTSSIMISERIFGSEFQ